MFVFSRKKSRIFALLCCVVALTTLFFSYTYHNPSMYFLKFAFGLSDKEACSCSRCIMEMDDDWFSERFNQSIPPLLSKKNSILSEETYTWFLRLQQESHPANYSDVVERLFELVPSEEKYMDSGPDRCRTCAVVGNSGNIKGSRYGADIDSHDFVIRMNRAVTQGYEEDVGSKTTHHLMYPESAKHLHNSTNLLLVPFKTWDLQWIIRKLTTQINAEVKLRMVNKDKVLIYNPSFFKYVYDNWMENHGRYPSTGFLALMFAIHVCDEVSVYGFGADKRGYWHHYWENNRDAGAFRATGVHDADFEHNVTMLLADKEKIKMFTGR